MQNEACLTRNLVDIKYKDGSSMAEHIGVFQNIVNMLGVVILSWMMNCKPYYCLWFYLIIKISHGDTF